MTSTTETITVNLPGTGLTVVWTFDRSRWATCFTAADLDAITFEDTVSLETIMADLDDPDGWRPSQGVFFVEVAETDMGDLHPVDLFDPFEVMPEGVAERIEAGRRVVGL